MNVFVMGALAALSMAQQTDTVIPLQNAKLLAVETPGGTIAVTGWDRDEIRIQAEHSHRSYVRVRRTHGGDRIQVEPEADRGPVTIVDFKLMVPRSLGLQLEGQYADLMVDGVSGTVSAETVQGDVTVRGGRGSVKVSSTTGKVLVEGAQGKIEAETAADEIRFVDVAGDVVAESAGGNILFENAHPTSVDVGTTGGRISYEGAFARSGTYYFGAHGGSIAIVVPEGTAASLSLATVHGSIVTNLNGDMERLKGGERHRMEVGGGGAVVEAETFAGRISVMRRGTEGAFQQLDRLDRYDRDLADVIDLGAIIEDGIRVGLEAVEQLDVRVELPVEWRRRKGVGNLRPNTRR